MFVNVDLIGFDAVCKMIQQTGLKKFIVYMQGSGKGAIPKYECTNTTNNPQAIKCFKDWAQNILMFNPQSAQCYDILLFDTVNDIDTDETNKRTNKVRFSFALSSSLTGNNFNTQQQHIQPQIDIAGEIQKGIELALLKKENAELKEQLEEYEDDDETDTPDLLDKITGIMQQVNLSKQAAQVSGDLDDEQILTKKTFYTDEQKQKKLANQKEALRILWSKNKNLDEDLMRLADLAQNNPILFQMTLQKLRGMVKLK